MAMELFVEQNGEISGPFSPQELKIMARDHEISKNDFVRKTRDGKPVKAALVKGLFAEPNTEHVNVMDKELLEPERKFNGSSLNPVTPPPSETVIVPPPHPVRETKAPIANKTVLLVSVVGLALVLSVGIGFFFLPTSEDQRTADEKSIAKHLVVDLDPAESEAVRPETKIDQAKQDELDWTAFTLNPPWKRYDIIEYKDINAEEHRFVMTGKIDKAKLERYAEEYAADYGSNLDAIEVRFYAKENRSKYRGESTLHLEKVEDIINDLKIFDEISVDLLACCCKVEKDGKPLFVTFPFEVPKQSLLVLRHVLRQRTLEAEKGLEKITAELAEFRRKSKEKEEQRDKERANERARLVARGKQLERQVQKLSETLAKPLAEIKKLDALFSKAHKMNDMATVKFLQSKIEKLKAENDLGALNALKIKVIENEFEIKEHDRLTAKLRKTRESAKQ